MKPKIKYFLLSISVLIVSILNITSAAIIYQDVSLKPQKLSAERQQQQYQQDHGEEGNRGSVLKGYRRFVLLTTGKQVKIYPLKEGNKLSDSGYYLVKIFDQRFYREQSYSSLVVNRHNETGTKADSILPPARPGSRKHSAARTSIIPANDRLDDDSNFIGDTEGESWISDVNYFFDLKYCARFKRPAEPYECMVIIYLDIKNQQIGYASIDLRRELNGAQDRTLWARKEGSIDINVDGKYSIPVTTELALDWFHQVLYANLHSSRGYETVILRFDLSEPAVSSPTIEHLNPCRGKKRLRNLNVDQNNGQWLFYSDMASHESDGRQKMSSVTGAIDVGSGLSRWISLRQHAVVAEHKIGNVMRFGISGSAPDSVSRRMYWLTEQNELRSSNFIGSDIRVEVQLPARPIIKEPGRTEIVQGSFYFSDHKRRLFCQGLPFQSLESGLQLLLIEDRLENFRIGSIYPPGSKSTCETSNKSSSGSNQEVPGSDPVYARRRPASIQKLVKDLAVSIAGDEYSVLRDRTGNDCIDRQLFEILLMPAALLSLIAAYVCKRRARKTRSLDEKLITKDKYPV